jgi:hypothetical protein
MEKFKDPRTGVLVEFDPVRHKYFIDGEHMQGVTTIIAMTTGRGGKISDLPKNVQGIINAAADYGTLVHEITHFSDIKKPGMVRKLLKQCILEKEKLDRAKLDAANWKKFLKEEGYEVEHSEHRVYSIKHRFAGTMDNVLRHIATNTRHSADKKTGLLKPEAKLQTSAYAGAWEEMTGESLDGRLVVQLDGGKTKRGYKVTPWPGWKPDYRVFLCKLRSHRWDMENGAH